jgi:hypothetical protein
LTDSLADSEVLSRASWGAALFLQIVPAFCFPITKPLFHVIDPCGQKCTTTAKITPRTAI